MMPNTVRRRDFVGLISVAAVQVGRNLSAMGDVREELKKGEGELSFRLGGAEWLLLRIPPGEFTMGTPLNEPGRESWELAPRHVRITRAFYMSKGEATNAQYRAVMGPQPHSAAGDQELPYAEARYSEALKFCAELSRRLGVTVTLPTEAQWEYACRAGTQTAYYTGPGELDLQRAAWYSANSGGSVHRGCEKQTNRWGLCDMLGNTSEPCLDYILQPDQLTVNDPVGRVSAEYGCARGGSWMDSAPHCRAGYRLRTQNQLAGLGIRIVILPS